MSDNFREPPVDPLEDTHPTGTYPQVLLNDQLHHTERQFRPNRTGRLIGLVSLIAAFGFTAATVFLLLAPQGTDEPVVSLPTQESQPTTAPDATTIEPTQGPPTLPPATTDDETEAVAAVPTTDPAALANLLQAPLEPVTAQDQLAINRQSRNPFTIIPDRPRNEIITYTVERGDTVDEISQRFGLEPETIAWSNDRRIIQVLRPGDVLNIPPVDGVYVTAIGSTRTLADYATQYKVNDPYIIIDSEFNPHLRGLSPDTIPPSGTKIFIPGGEAEEIVWQADISVDDGGGGSGAAGTSYVVFQPGDPGDCGRQEITGGSFWTHPVPSGGYQISRGFSSWHTGIDLAASVGVPIAAANGGRVIFAGWNSYGYGYMIALIHGPNMTVYGHLSQVNVSCGQDVAAGQTIGLMGSSGNSSGPHLHFEIRSRSGNTYVPIDPSAYIGF